MIEVCKNKRNEFKTLIHEIEILSCNYLLKQNNDGKEHFVKYDLEHAWKDYQFVLNGILYR